MLINFNDGMMKKLLLNVSQCSNSNKENDFSNLKYELLPFSSHNVINEMIGAYQKKKSNRF